LRTTALGAIGWFLLSATGCGTDAPVPAVASGGSEPSEEAVRLSGTVEAVQTRAVTAPRLQGPSTPLLVTYLVPAGTRVEAGDPLVAFDRQQQERNAFDRAAELVNLEGEIIKRRAEQAAADASDRTALLAAENDVERARLDVRTNDLIAGIAAEKNSLALEQALARLEQLRTTYDLKREAAAADLRILEIRRDRAAQALQFAQQNAQLMEVAAPFAGLVVIKRVYRSGTFVELAEGDEVRPGTAIVDIVDTSVMQVRALVNQADFGLVQPGQRVRVGLDGFPNLSFDGRIENITPLATTSSRSQRVRTFTTVVSIDGSDPQLLPDLTASIEFVPDGPTGAAGGER